jgi:hypothetical protein
MTTPVAHNASVTQHQNNYTRILKLRHEAELLDSKIKTSVQLLADLRKDLLAIPLDAPEEKPRPIPYKELLTYAKNIAPFTIPPTFRPKPISAVEVAENGQPPVAQDLVMEANIDSAIASTPAAEVSAEADPEAAQSEEEKRALARLTEEQKAWLTNLNALPFKPWPGDGEMVMGALHTLNHQVVNGNDPTDIARVLEEERYAEDARQRAAGEENKRSNENYAMRRKEKEDADSGTVKKKNRFGLEDSDDEDEDF